MLDLLKTTFSGKKLESPDLKALEDARKRAARARMGAMESKAQVDPSHYSQCSAEEDDLPPVFDSYGNRIGVRQSDHRARTRWFGRTTSNFDVTRLEARLKQSYFEKSEVRLELPHPASEDWNTASLLSGMYEIGQESFCSEVLAIECDDNKQQVPYAEANFVEGEFVHEYCVCQDDQPAEQNIQQAILEETYAEGFPALSDEQSSPHEGLQGLIPRLRQIRSTLD